MVIGNYFLPSTYWDISNLVPSSSFHLFFLQKIPVQSVVTLTVWYVLFLSASEQTPLLPLSLLWTRDILSLSLVQILSSVLLHDLTSFLLVSSHSPFSQILWSTYRIILVPTFLLLPLILLLPLLHSKFLTSLLLFLFPSTFLSSFFSFFLFYSDFLQYNVVVTTRHKVQ